MFYDLDKVNDLLDSNELLAQYKDHLINSIVVDEDGYLIMDVNNVHCVIDLHNYSIIEGAVNIEEAI